jgi:hypothetical protein
MKERIEGGRPEIAPFNAWQIESDHPPIMCFARHQLRT